MEMKLNGKGALPSQLIRQLLDAGFIKGSNLGNVKPSSLDLTLSDEIYKVDGIFQPRPNETVRQVLKQIKKIKYSFDKPLERDQMYIVRLNETLTLPDNVYAYCNPKSSSGRVDVHVRLITDKMSRYDTVEKGYKGELWVAIMSKTFFVKMSPGQSYNQLRFFNEDTRLSEMEFEIAMKQYNLIWSSKTKKPHSYSDFVIRDGDGSFIQTLDIMGDVVGYVGIKRDKVIDLGKIKHYDYSEFFEPLKRQGDFIHLKKDHFYILSTYEAVRIPPEFACEMVSMDDRSGEFRSHYAGFLDPGWGWGKKGEGKGRPFTLEVRPFEDLVIRHKQPIAKIKFERLTTIPDSVYDAMNSNYLKQSGPKLGKNFK